MNMALATDSFGYEIEIVSEYYAKYRPSFPPELYEKILQYLDEGSLKSGSRGLAVDVGCGCGLSTLALAKHFEVVTGIDSSETQLTKAEKASVDYGNVSYRQTFAEDLSSVVAMGSADLVTAGQAVHFFDMVKFYRESLKILKRGGALAVYSYNFPLWKNQDADNLIYTFMRGTLKKYWRKENNHVFNGLIQPWTLLTQFFEQCHRMRDVFSTPSVEEKVFQGSSPVCLLLGRKL